MIRVIRGFFNSLLTSKLARLCYPLYRVDKARSREMGGFRLGLSIVKHLVQGTHGEALLESEVGKGSRLVVQLPAA